MEGQKDCAVEGLAHDESDMRDLPTGESLFLIGESPFFDLFECYFWTTLCTIFTFWYKNKRLSQHHQDYFYVFLVFFKFSP